MRSAIVLGAGMIGVSTALHLQKRGWQVVVLDRRGPGEETSHGNAGIIQSEAVQPYAMPRDVISLARIGLRRANDVRYRLAALPGQAGPLLRYWWNSEPRRHERISMAYATLAAQSVAEHGVLIDQSGSDNLIQRDGYLHVFRDQAGFDEAIVKAKHIGAVWNVPYRLLDGAALRALEPSVGERIIGAIHWTAPWAVRDPGRLVKNYAELFVRNGGTIEIGDAASLRQTAQGWSVAVNGGVIEALAAVVALGPWSPSFLRPYGYRFPMVMKRGYHRHFAGGAPLTRPLFDVDRGYVVAPMARGLRITTGADLAGFDMPANETQLRRSEAYAREFIDLGTSVDAEPWFGTRPFLASMLPVIGEAPRHRGLWLHFGHGHQGFTMGAASGRLIAEMMTGEAPYIDPAPFMPRAA